MKIAIVGSRDFPDLDKVREYVHSLPNGTIIISGGARGVDQAAKRAAIEGLAVVDRNFTYHEYLPDWDKHGRAAGMIRNRHIVAAADAVVAFWDGRSPGTRNSINLARKLGKPCTVFLPKK